MENRTYEETMAWIEQIGKSGIHLGLERMNELLERMGHPERSLKIIHVAGTNGKGSVCTMIAAILKTAGYKVGRYISPTLYDYRERIQINGDYIEKEALTEGMSRIRQIYGEMERDGIELPTVFEAETALGFWYFKEKACDYVVLETGMGGRLDSTNVVEHPVLTVLTSISMDHMAQLGNTLTEIASEKAGILKNGVAAVVYPQQKEAMDVIERVSREKNIPWTVVDTERLRVGARQIFEDGRGLKLQQTFDYKDYRDLNVYLGGTYQVKNACLAIEAVEALALKQPLEPLIREGLSEARWPGRFECLSKRPLMFVDGAHNPEGAVSLRETIRTWFPEKRCLLVMGVFADKDYPSILKAMAPVSDTLISFTPENARGLESERLAAAAEAFYANVLDGGTAEGALNLAGAWAGDGDIIIIFGSLSTISTICDIISPK
ncbi:bifunctional folylpolyglutamate synthase/dihydrofolate synthase [Frisingicoccus sp.]|uniref:bifunctional folylpolyglutamate synthase/dihydrofolate synthase n=1 Tax=Frisingicoccus sp. TaxID=1918627 RepID=UPI003AB7D686